MHYLIVEDDVAIRNILKDVFEILETNGVFTFFENGHQAWDWLNEVEANTITSLPEIAFLDIRMPGPQGYEIAERIRKIPSVSNMGIILMTAYELSEAEYKDIMSRSQADRYITKPLPGVKGLNRMVDEIMSLRRSSVETPKSAVPPKEE